MKLGEKRFEEFRFAKKAVTSLLRSHIKPSGAAPQFMDLLDGLFHPQNLTYVRCCQASFSFHSAAQNHQNIAGSTLLGNNPGAFG